MNIIWWATIALVFAFFSLGFTLGGIYYEAYANSAVAGEGADGICVHYFKNGYIKAGTECLEEQAAAREKEKCEKSGRINC
ncbi:hypothetical protein LCGC14_0380750 [marine sediment metagenome]|uniref:Uncharacterized protein n=1 Tax=marine sediment metagenome TaxID=412755 RepID=A0A0F9T8F4_9ZZZZ